MRSLRSLFLLMTMSACFLSAGCTGLTLGPQVRTEYVILHAGKPIQILENKKVKGRVFDGTGDAVEQDIGGGVWMPTDHWEAVQRALK